MTERKKRRQFFLIATLIVIAINAILGCINMKNYNISYPKTLQDVQRDIEEDIVAIKDRVITKGSVVLLVTLQDGSLCLYTLKKGLLTSKYKIDGYEFYDDNDQKYFEKGLPAYIGRDCYVRNYFEKYSCVVGDDYHIEIDPETFKSNIPWDYIFIRLLYIEALWHFMLFVLAVYEKQKEEKKQLAI